MNIILVTVFQPFLLITVGWSVCGNHFSVNQFVCTLAFFKFNHKAFIVTIVNTFVFKCIPKRFQSRQKSVISRGQKLRLYLRYISASESKRTSRSA